MGQINRFIAADLKDDRFFEFRESKEPIEISMFDGLARDHFGIEQCVARDLAHEIAIVTIGAIHHWRDAKRVSR